MLKSLLNRISMFRKIWVVNTEQGFIKVDFMQKTTVPGVFACGDNVTMMRSVANAVAQGNFTGAMVNKELSEEEF
jgi:thioredoxin reductase